MILSELLAEVRDTLQDGSKRRWLDSELEKYVNQGIRDIAKKTKFFRQVQDLSVVAGTTQYTLTYKVIEFDSISTAQDHTVLDNKTIEFADPKEETVQVVYYGYPLSVSVATDGEIPMEEDLEDALKYYVLKKAYEKEDSTENFRKATYYKNEYREILADDMTRWHGHLDVDLAKKDFLE